MSISLIAAMGSNGAIGLKGKIPWHIPNDLKRFKELTWESPILMGRKTYESIGKPLPGRTNVIISGNPIYHIEGGLVFNDIDTALNRVHEDIQEVFIIGGAYLYEHLLPYADTMYITLIDKQFEGDVFFPEIDMNEWIEVDRVDITSDPANSFTYSFLKFERRLS